MSISKEQLESFKDIYKKQYGKEISDAEALKQATALLNMMKVIYKPIKKSKHGK